MITELDVANNLRAERCRRNLTIDEVCNELGISRPTYIALEKDASGLKISILLQLSKLYGCSIENFFVDCKLTKENGEL